ncbi:tRNA pseudouridine synthase A [Gillisia limnaea]|uniref:tRNA pseudouridine synthase A n=1 Tax=Gillisia limnaea (strain DSM 15749 / LMG 21470 / R-8282) TaxID=865937 RepID=H2BZ58_GILLR|nr:tRNA pseudouridine synthase A [Gillisia limnaea]EHQ01187.1 tRNA pseudouridine synthase A [Gillisia limnaea DSM 15749]
MNRTRYYYLFKLQFLGYRLHGWQRQPNLKTVESLLKKTFKFILQDQKFKILGSSRTDAMVSANDAAFELFLYDSPILDFDDFLNLLNLNLPPDIKATGILEVDEKFNIIQHPKIKEYLYLFSFGQKNHPFCAPLMANFQKDLDIESMIKAAKLFQGTHNFKNYCSGATEKTRFERKVITSEIVENTIYKANFFPEESFVFHVHGSGFLRYQIRLMMGTLIQLGLGEMCLKDIEESLLPGNEMVMKNIAPASGLILNKVEFE